MVNTFKVQFFSPDNRILFDEVVSLSVDGLEGKLMILAYHSPYLIYLLPGIITAQMSNQTKEKIIIGNGILEVANNNCSIVTNQIQVFDHLTHDEKSFESKRIGIYLSYLDGKSL